MNSFFEQVYVAIPEASREQIVLALETLSKAIKTASK
jgi:hypothetical protein